MLKRLTRWWKVTRHIRALDDANYVVVRRDAFRAHCLNVFAFQRWVDASGSLQDGTVPNHTKKMVEAHARTINFHLPQPMTREGVENGA